MAGRVAGARPTRALTEGAVFAAITALIGVAALFLAPGIAVIVGPIPILLVGIRWGLRTAGLATMVAGLILLQLFGPLAALSVALASGSMGLALAWSARRGHSAPWIVCAGAGALFAVMLSTVPLTNLVLHQNVIDESIALELKTMAGTVAAMERAGAPAPVLEQWREFLDSPCSERHCFPSPAGELTRALLPLLAAMAALTWAYFCYLLARSVFRRVGHTLPAMPALLTWRLDRPRAAIVLWAMVGTLAASLWVPEAGVLATNASYAAFFVFLFQGVLVGVAWMNRRRIPRLTQIVAGLFALNLAMQIPAGLPAIMLLGVLDSFWDFRRLGPARRPQVLAGPAGTTAPGAPVGGAPAVPRALEPKRKAAASP
jgi:uncharacterized protein YybS (DUF2232 family)